MIIVYALSLLSTLKINGFPTHGYLTFGEQQYTL